VMVVLAEHQRANNVANSLWGTVFVVLALLGWFGYRSLPQVSALFIDLIPTEVDVQLGDFAYDNMGKEGVELKSAEVVEPVEQIVERLTADIEGEWEFKVHVVEADILNAYALPGGNIVVYTGLIEESTKAEELAGVLAHEIAHVTQRHGMSRILEAAGVALVANVLLGDVEGLLALGVELFSASAVNSYSRDSESEADSVGLQYLLQGNIDPSGMVDFFKIMESEEGEIEEMIPLWMRSHPETESRIESLQAQIQSLPEKKYVDLNINWVEYQEIIQNH